MNRENGTGGIKMAVHVIIDVKVKNKEKYVEVSKKLPVSVQKYGGRYLSRGGKINTLSGNWRPDAVVLIEFDSIDQVNRWINSPEYKETEALRGNTTESNLISIETSPAAKQG
jgi:uncharacterized protein (DUF1330 family)